MSICFADFVMDVGGARPLAGSVFVADGNMASGKNMNNRLAAFQQEVKSVLFQVPVNPLM